ncbi:MAG: sterol desaturase [Hyphococcus sp.]|nr:MAG: sterol desaturase [Marinicaulis sp.]
MSLENISMAKLAIAGVFFVTFFVAERLVNAANQPKDLPRLLRNGGLWLVVFALSPFIVAPIAGLGANELLWRRPEWMNEGAPAIVVFIGTLLALDCWTYWLHRAYHKVPLMWRLHEIHHRDEFLDTTSAFRFHIFEVVLSALLRLIPIALLAVPLQMVIIFEALLLSTAIFHHSNVRLPKGLETGLSRIIVTPSIHWVHHHARKQDTDSNYAAILSVWDRLFGSASPSARILDMKIGVEGVEDQSLLRLMLMPLMRRRP